MAFAVTFLAILAVGGFLVVTLIVAVDQLVDLIPTYEDEVLSIKESIAKFLAGLGLNQANFSAAGDLFDPGKVLDLYAGLIGGAAEALSSIVLIFMTIIFMLIEAFNIPKKVAAELEAGNDYIQRLADFSVDIRRYVSFTT